MAATVPEQRIELVETEVRTSNAVRAVSWQEAAQLQMWLAGRGSIEVPGHAPLVEIPTSTTATFAYWTKPRFQTCRYALTLHLIASSFRDFGAAYGAVTVNVPSGGTGVDVLIGSHADPHPVTIVFDRTAQSSAEAELSFDIVTNASNRALVECVGIEAVPRTLLPVDSNAQRLVTWSGDALVTQSGDRLVTYNGASSNNLGVDRLRFWPRQPIMEPSLSSGLLNRQNDLRDACRRVGMFQFSRGTNDPWLITTASPSWSNLFVDAIALLGRSLYSSDTTRTLSWRVLAKCSDGSTSGQVRVSNVSGGVGLSTISIPTSTTNWTWFPTTGGAAATFACDAENNTVADGRRSGRWDDHTFEANRTAGAGSVQISTISVFEA